MEKNLIAKKVFVNPVFKDRATVLKTMDETGGAYLLGELEVSPGGGNPLHTHSTFEETFTAVDGELGVVLNDKKLTLRPGESITVPRYTPHHFFNEGSKAVTCHVKLVPGNDGFIKGLAIAYGLAADGKTNKKGFPKKLAHLALMMELMDTKPVGLLGLMFPVFKRLANNARKRGIEKALLEKYYYE